MAIIYNSENKTFHLRTSNTSYVMGVLEEKYLLHLYYGSKVLEFTGGIDSIPMSANQAWSPVDVEELAMSTNAYGVSMLWKCRFQNTCISCRV